MGAAPATCACALPPPAGLPACLPEATACSTSPRPLQLGVLTRLLFIHQIIAISASPHHPLQVAKTAQTIAAVVMLTFMLVGENHSIGSA